MGISAKLVSGSWSPVSLGLLIGGIVIIGLWVLLLGILAPGFWQRRSIQVGTNAIVATLSVVVLLAVINFLAARYVVRLDLTENQLFSLSPLSQQMVKNLQQPVKVWVFDPIPNPNDRELLENYRRYGAKLEFEFVDPQVRPALAQKFNIRSPGEVYLEYGTERQFVQAVSNTERLEEAKLTSAIERITSDRTDVVYFLQGHGERPIENVEGGLSQAVSSLAEKNFTAQPLNLAERSEVPKDASLVVIAGPKRGLFELEVQALSKYLAKGGSLLVMVDPDTNPGLDSLFADWGVTLDTRIAIDASGQGRLVGLGPATPLVTSYGDHPITQNFGNGFSLYPLARPVETTPVEGIKETSLVRTNEESWAENNPEDQPLEFNEDKGDRPGPLVLGVALSRKAGYQPTLPKAQPEPTPSPTVSPNPEASPTPFTNKSPEASPSPEAKTTPSPAPSPTVSPNQSPTASPAPNNQDNADTQKINAEARLIVYGNSNFASDGWFDQQLNSDVFLNSVSWLSNRNEKTLSIRPKAQQNRRINLTPVQAALLGWTAVGIMPLIGFTAAGVIWWL
ncbi:MAG TPA: ABC transporter, partial [Cyanobacteria bacterium UBA8803]|nr:ABC transporter [Cyanobacteria bacterium UBA8803]